MSVRSKNSILMSQLLLTKTPIRTVLFFQTLDSTNDYAKELLKRQQPLELPLLILAQKQTAGRGRGAKKWWTGKGSLAVSLVLKLSDFHLHRDDFTSFSPFVAQAVAETIRSVFDQHNTNSTQPKKFRNIVVHPPNDVYVEGKKVSGILIECPVPNKAIVGIGVNTNNTVQSLPCEFRDIPITTLFDELGTKIDHDLFLVELFQRFFQLLEKHAQT